MAVVAEQSMKFKIDVVTPQEIRWSGQGSTLYSSVEQKKELGEIFNLMYDTKIVMGDFNAQIRK